MNTQSSVYISCLLGCRIGGVSLIISNNNNNNNNNNNKNNNNNNDNNNNNNNNNSNSRPRRFRESRYCTSKQSPVPVYN